MAVRDHPASAEKATAVLPHGFCLNQNSWNGQGRCLLRRWGSRMRLNTYDRRGHGQSGTALSHTYRVPTLADDLHSVLAAPHVRTPLVLVGHSVGAMTALTVAGQPSTDQAVPSCGLELVATAAGRRLTEPGTGRLLAIPADGVLPALLGHVPDHALQALAAAVCTKSAPGRGCAPAARYFLAAATTSAMASTPLTTALGFLPVCTLRTPTRPGRRHRAHRHRVRRRRRVRPTVARRGPGRRHRRRSPRTPTRRRPLAHPRRPLGNHRRDHPGVQYSCGGAPFDPADHGARRGLVPRSMAPGDQSPTHR